MDIQANPTAKAGFDKAVSVVEMDASKYPAIVHRQVTDEIDRLKPKVEAESSKPEMIWVWWAQLVPNLFIKHKPITRDAVRDLGPDAYRQLVYLEASLAAWLAENLDRYLVKPKGYKDCLQAARKHLEERLIDLGAALA